MTTWDPFDKSSEITLSQGDLVAEVTSFASDWQCVRSIPVLSGTKSYCEIKIEKGLENEIIIGLGLESDAIGSSFGTYQKTNQISSAYTAGDPKVYLSSDAAWAISGQGLVSDSTNDWDSFTWSGRTASYANVSGMLAHTVNAKLYPMPLESNLDFKTFGYLGIGHLLYKNSGPFSWGSTTFWNYMDPAWGSSFKQGDVISVAIDATRGWAWFAKNGTWQKSGNPGSLSFPSISSLGENQNICLFVYMRKRTNRIRANFGLDNFLYSVPAGFSGIDANISNNHITGVVKKLGVPVSRTVCLIDRGYKSLIATTSSNSVSGIYSFTNVRGGRKYLLVVLPLLAEANINALCLDHVISTSN